MNESRPKMGASGEERDGVTLPAPTPWPMSFALGICFLAAGLVTSPLFSVVGALLFIASVAGWIRELAPGRGHVHEPLAPPHEWPAPPKPAPGAVEALQPGTLGHRLRVPESAHPYSAGVKGGLAGGLAMAFIATIYGVVAGKGIWYPANLLAAMAAPRFDEETLPLLEQFSLLGIALAIGIHIVGSLFIGLLYGMLLPMLPGRPYLWGGIVIPLVWTGAIHGVLGVINPALGKHVDWNWFVASQVAFGVVAGIVVVRSERVYVEQLWKPQPRS